MPGTASLPPPEITPQELEQLTREGKLSGRFDRSYNGYLATPENGYRISKGTTELFSFDTEESSTSGLDLAPMNSEDNAEVDSCHEDDTDNSCDAEEPAADPGDEASTAPPTQTEAQPIKVFWPMRVASDQGDYTDGEAIPVWVRRAFDKITNQYEQREVRIVQGLQTQVRPRLTSSFLVPSAIPSTWIFWTLIRHMMHECMRSNFRRSRRRTTQRQNEMKIGESYSYQSYQKH